ncbi:MULTISPECIES: hypothetical protein [unclassified Polaribacter]|uniref:hypothetical protein n=1 Tax=unclassified Polaribacter TaxID=196858 RepID=UPI0011BD73BA|nr:MULTISPECIES: hypothetical protein [unclassified Polaribacter]TXD50259.1 hypothetical protein ES043_16780 [Polaribacter sp. IC063]TXD57801.1 hypothetical protein ES044_13955 [Polaribacter sp. IC066]
MLLLISTIYTYTQNPKIEYENFKLQEDKKIVWQKVYEFKGSKDSITEILKEFITTNSFLNNLKYTNYGFTGFSSYPKISDLRGMPIAVQTAFNSFVSIDIKENRCRISISNIKFKPLNMDFGGIEMNTNSALEDITVRNNYHEIRKNNTARKTLSNLNKDFLKILTLKINKNEDW